MYMPDYFASVHKTAIPVQLAARCFVIPIPKDVGFEFHNYTDEAAEIVRPDGRRTIIINNLSEAQAANVRDYYNAIISLPEKATEADIRKVMRHAHRTLGVDDFYNGNRNKIPEYEIVETHPQNKECGIFIRHSPETRSALLGVGSGTFAGPAASPQRFHKNVVLISNEKKSWLVQTDVFLKTYKHPDGRPIELNDLPTYAMHMGQLPLWVPQP